MIAFENFKFYQPPLMVDFISVWFWVLRLYEFFETMKFNTCNNLFS